MARKTGNRLRTAQDFLNAATRARQQVTRTISRGGSVAKQNRAAARADRYLAKAQRLAARGSAARSGGGRSGGGRSGGGGGGGAPRAGSAGGASSSGSV